VPAEQASGTAREQDMGVSYDTSVAHIARVYDYWLGGKDNFAADREAAEQAIQVNPDIVRTARANRAFLARAVKYLTAEAGIRQFLDIGTGIPTNNNTHEVAQSIAPESRVVYVDHDPIVLSHARALLSSTPEGETAYIDADLREPTKILREARQTLDFTRPVAIMLIAILHFIGPEDDPYRVVRQLVDAVPSGSYLVISHPASDIDAGVMVSMASRLNKLMAQKGTARTRDQVGAFFAGLDLVEPGLVRVPDWRPTSQLETASHCAMWAAIAVKP
jgi:hypothetical protein